MKSSYKNFDIEYAKMYAIFIEYYSIAKTVTSDKDILIKNIISRDFGTPIDFSYNLNDIQYIIEVKARHNSINTYSDWVLESKKAHSLFSNIERRLNYKRTDENLYDHYMNLSKVAKQNNIKLLYYNYFVKDDILVSWDLLDIFINDKFDIDKNFSAPVSSTNGFSGFDITTDKTVYKLKIKNITNKYDKLIGNEPDIKFERFKQAVHSIRQRKK